MDLGETGINVIFAILIVVLLVVNVFFKKRRSEKTPLGMVAALLTDVHKNEKLIETFSFHWRIKKFSTGSWKRNRSKIDFLPQELQFTLSKAFEMAEDVNQRIDAGKRARSDSYMAGIDVDKLKGPLAKSKQELQDWLQENMQNPEYAPKRRGLFG